MPPAQLPTNFPFSPHVGCQTPCTPTLQHVLRHDHHRQDQTATVPVFNYGFEGSNRAVAIATFKISQHPTHRHRPPKSSTISESTGNYGKPKSSFDAQGGAYLRVHTANLRLCPNRAIRRTHFLGDFDTLDLDMVKFHVSAYHNFIFHYFVVW